MPKVKYSAKERKAYHMGRAYATAKAGKRIACPDEATKQSFRNGVNDVRGKKSTAKKSARKGGKNKGGFCYVVNSDGEIVEVMKC